MRRLFSALLFTCLAALHLPATAGTDHLDGVLSLAKDDITAMAQVHATPRHVLVYFGDHAN